MRTVPHAHEPVRGVSGEGMAASLLMEASGAAAQNPVFT